MSKCLPLRKKITCLIHVTVSFKIPKHPQMRTTAGCGCTTAGCGCTTAGCGCTETPASVSKKHCECNTAFFCEASVCHPTKIAFNKMSRAPEDLTAINTKAVDYQKKFVRISNLDPMIDSIVQGHKPMDIHDIHDVNTTYPFRTAL